MLPVPTAGLLAATGAGKLFGRRLRARAARTALPRLTGGNQRATLVLRVTGGAELLLAVALLAAPGRVLPGVGTALLGLGFLVYLGLARRVAPESSCGCTANDTAPITWHSFARAAAVVLGGAAAVAGGRPWWEAAGQDPVPAAAVAVAWAALLAHLSAGPGPGWRIPLRRLRLRLFGNPLGGREQPVPVAASVELLERSLAWETAAPLIRSGLVEHWDEDGWRILHYSGARHDRACACDRRVSVLFAMDAEAHLDHTLGQVIRVSVVDEETGEVLTPEAVPEPRRRLPLAG
ncbi:hypothetical protein D7294_26545 [Streptomyces hoynatensis]|uniref:Methylamine utilisation protein MauE domain-containing protein n=1 Tax=Streptomyces hoynatensis TaxID=1141874 RepID=A0A3A9YPC5_9ACTN|nr:hypothetical protein D7294_26545 [Streptomyces hoynatensis]